LAQILFCVACHAVAVSLCRGVLDHAQGLALASEADESSTGPASPMLIDPDGNAALIDQHVDSPPN
jgi:hypothetical protein